MYERLRHLFIAFKTMMIMVSAACVVEPPVEDVSLSATVDTEATAEARRIQEWSIEATDEARVENKMAGQSTWVPEWSMPTIATENDSLMQKAQFGLK